jgi:hypothetical protein
MEMDKYSNGKPKLNTRPDSAGRHFSVGESVRIVGLMPRQHFNGVVVRLNPVEAVVTDKDPVWHNCPVGGGKVRKRTTLEAEND